MYEIITPNGTVAYVTLESHEDYMEMINQKPYTD